MSKSVCIFPEISQDMEMQLFDALKGKTPLEVRSDSESLNLDQVTYVAAGNRVERDHLLEIRQEIRSLAEKFGWPDPVTTKNSSRFTQEVAGLIHKTMQIYPANAARKGVWSFLSLQLLPDIGVWRWPNLTPERLMGHAQRSNERNFLRVPWWRAELLGASSTDPPAVWIEDNLAQIIENPGLFRNRRLTKVTATFWNQQKEDFDVSDHQETFRQICIRLRRQTAFTSLEILEDGEITNLLIDILTDTKKSLKS